ncbi:GA module-containing protein, partial [Staphylococcus epidermidis]|uniref:GA module-containing protein n=1 Tax=Staphylococcus epidermidis TaxID=1282 RepID=UPI0011AAB5F3
HPHHTLHQPKNNPNQTITNLSNFNNPQKHPHKNLLNTPSTLQQLQQNLQTPQQLHNPIPHLPQTIPNKHQLKPHTKYLNQHPQINQNYHHPVQPLQTII